MFIGAMMLIVLPLFLFICARMTANSEYGHTFGAKALEAIFYVFAGLSLVGLIILIVQVFK
jgi:hypothetical protein